jgi:uncharacterized protein YbcV (DUF1398 family)
MRKVIFVSLLAVLTVCFCFFTPKAFYNKQTVNAIIGDISFLEKFGHAPDLINDENLRIKTHLEYVEKQLRRKEVAGLSPELQQRRSQFLDFLHDYWEAGIFPRNYDYRNTRKPCFIDKDGRICAVGYLIEKSVGRKIAENINSRHKYEEILAMNDKVVDEWIDASGLSKEECAMIQPSYGGGGGLYPTRSTASTNSITKGEGISSSVFSGANVSINTINLLQTIKGTSNKTVGILGLITGAGQTFLGVAMFPENNTDYYGTNTTNEGKKTLAMVNVGLGTTTMLLSAWNLISNKKPRYTKVTWNLNSFETPNNTLGMAITCRRRL